DRWGSQLSLHETCQGRHLVGLADVGPATDHLSALRTDDGGGLGKLRGVAGDADDQLPPPRQGDRQLTTQSPARARAERQAIAATSSDQMWSWCSLYAARPPGLRRMVKAR